MDRPFIDLPIWVLFVGTTVLVLASMEIGYRYARRRQRDAALEKEAPVGAIVGATLGLLAFLLAFTFGMAADAFHARKTALAQEVSAIRMTYMMGSLAAEPQRRELRTVLRDYVDERLRWASGQPSAPGSTAAELVDRLWKSAADIAAQSPGQVDVFLGYVGRIVELRDEREMVRERSRIPGPVWAALYLVTFLAAVGVGYHGGVAGTQRTPIVVAVAIAFSAVIMLIADLDAPGKGLINVSQQPLVDLRAALAASKP